MAVTNVDLTPPVGTRSGLPLTFVWADDDSLTNDGYPSASKTGNPMKENNEQWKPDHLANAVDKPKAVTRWGNQTPTTIDGYALSYSWIGIDGSASEINTWALGQTVNTSSPMLNFGTGDLEYAQMMLHTVNGRFALHRTQPIGTVLTNTKAGRYNTDKGDQYTTGLGGRGRPANHTWHRFSTITNNEQVLQGGNDTILPAHDVYAGRYTASQDGPLHVGSGVVHKTKMCLPSNGMGATYGDNHNMKYAISLNSAPVINASDFLGTPMLGARDDSFTMSQHWSLNLQSYQPIRQHTDATLVPYKTISQPDGLGGNAVHSADPIPDMPFNETIQYIGTNDFVSSNGNPVLSSSERRWRPLGRPDLGNIGLTDACGLVGYEGIFTATAFMSVSEDGNPDNVNNTWSGVDEGTFAGINIQVHSGLAIRRNGLAYHNRTDADRIYRYGTDGEYIQPISEVMMTTGNRDVLQSATHYNMEDARNDNASKFRIGRCTRHISGSTVPFLGDDILIPTNTGEDTVLPVGYILGDNNSLSGGNYQKTTSASQDFMKNMIPTKIQVIPAMVNHKQVDVEAGGSHPSTTTFKFNKPNVDYHVLVSLTPRARLSIEGHNNNERIGTPTQRNNPEARINVDLNLKDEGCYLYHAIFRINPDLERIYVDATESAKLCSPLDVECPKSVMPRNWNLIQLTPFKPLASSGFAEIPLLSGAIEAGGFYQQGGISHHWSADVFNDELFVATDVIEMAHLNPTVWGIGQMKESSVNKIESLEVPDGPEMLIFKYTPSLDPFYTNKEHDTILDKWYLEKLFGADSVKGLHSNTNYPITQTESMRNKGTDCWSVHDWVFPQIEAMRYLGVELKTFMMHPRHSLNDAESPMLHPTFHVGDFQIMEDGRMKILAIHRDYITEKTEYPSPIIGYPPQPDIAQQGRCPAGYYYHNGQCKPIIGTNPAIPADTLTTHFDPILGLEDTSKGPPLPILDSGLQYLGGYDNFGPVPTWTSMLGGTSARSLVLLFNNKKAREIKGSKTFTFTNDPEELTETTTTLTWSPTLRYELDSKPAVFDATKEKSLVYQNWNKDVGWWSGSQLSYWFQESGQKAIPITYGSYPECRMAFPNFAKSIPHLQLEDFMLWREDDTLIPALMTNLFSNKPIPADFMAYVDAKLTRPFSGYPLYQPTINFSMMNPANGETYQTWDISSQWENLLLNWHHLFQTHYNTTTIGFADYGGAANPYQELGWAGWSFATGLYDPTPSDGSQFFSDQPASIGITPPVTITQTLGLWNNFVADTITDSLSGNINQYQGGMCVVSHHGPLHYGMISKDHPYKIDRLWKQVNAGVGYDMPLELLIPEKVNVRARAKAKNSLDLELHLPLHRYNLENNPMIGKIKQMGLSGTSVMSPYIAQPYLRTNLWNIDTSMSQGEIEYHRLNAQQRIVGKPIASGGANLLAPTFSEFWKDHPTENFHAGAIPINTGNDYDALHVANEKYSPALIAQVDRMSKHDYIATAEQLQSTVDVHLSNSIRPVWDSGGIVSARGSGFDDTTMQPYTPKQRASQDGGPSVGAINSLTSSGLTGLGMGQRILRTPDGTLHTFSLDRSGLTGSDNIPVWTHYSKPAHSDLFWNRKAVKTNNQVHDGKDEVGPHLKIIAGATPTDYSTQGSAFVSDSNGTIHAIVEVKLPSGQHVLYYTYASKTLITTQPELVYSWDWSVHTPVLVGGSNDWDLREPSLVCDSKDRLHLACVVVERNNDVAIPAGTHILYTLKLNTETLWPTLASGTGYVHNSSSFTVSSTWQIVSNRPSGDTVTNTLLMKKGHHTYDNSKPKVCLQGDDTPVVFFKGVSYNYGTGFNFATAWPQFVSDSVYANLGKVVKGLTPSGRFTFDVANQTLIIGANMGYDAVSFYDAVIDSDDIAYVSSIIENNSGDSFITSWRTKEDWSLNYVAGSGIQFMALFNSVNDYKYNYKHMTSTISDKNELHIVLGFTIPNIMIGDPIFATSAHRAGGAPPYQWAGTPTRAQLEGYEQQTLSWPDGGANKNTMYSEKRSHFMEVFIPSGEISQTSPIVARDVNVRWLSVPSMVSADGQNYSPASSAQTGSGHEDFTHTAPQLRYQRHHGHNAGEIDLRWTTNELSWYSTHHFGNKLYYPFTGGGTMSIGENTNTGEGIAGWP